MLVFDAVASQSQVDFLKVAREQKHTLLLLLAAQAVLIAVMTSGLTDRPVPKAATIIAAIVIFAAETGELNKTIPTGAQVAAASLIPIAIVMTNVFPIPKTITSQFALALLASFIAVVGTWFIASTPAGPILAFIFGEELVIGGLTLIVGLAWVVGIGSTLGLISVVVARNIRPSAPVEWDKAQVKRRRRR